MNDNGIDMDAIAQALAERGLVAVRAEELAELRLRPSPDAVFAIIRPFIRPEILATIEVQSVGGAPREVDALVGLYPEEAE